MSQQSPILRVRVRGPLACFTRPELKVERVSYPVMTPSAARGILEAILWKPAIAWNIERIYLLKEIQFTAFRRNEVNYKAGGPSASVINNGGLAPVCFADENRTQRNTVALRDVDYVIEAHFTMTDKAGPDDNINKFVEMFKRRVEKGQHFHQPYLGCREFIAEIMPANDIEHYGGENKDLGLMLWDIDFGEQNIPVFFPAKLEKGILEVPKKPKTALSGRKGGGG